MVNERCKGLDASDELTAGLSDKRILPRETEVRARRPSLSRCREGQACRPVRHRKRVRPVRSGISSDCAGVLDEADGILLIPSSPAKSSWLRFRALRKRRTFAAKALIAAESRLGKRSRNSLFFADLLPACLRAMPADRPDRPSEKMAFAASAAIHGGRDGCYRSVGLAIDLWLRGSRQTLTEISHNPRLRSGALQSEAQDPAALRTRQVLAIPGVILPADE